MATLLELLRAKKQELAAGSRRKTLKPQPGTGRYRILPSWRGEGQQFWHDFGQHYIKDLNMKMSAVYICADKTFGRPCAICAAIGAGMASADDLTKDVLKEANAGGRVLLNALHLDGPTPNEIQILELSPTAFGAFVRIAEDYEDAGESIFADGKAKDVLITREGAGINTKYTMLVAAKTTAVPPSALLKPHDLDEYVNQESEAQQLRALNSVRAVSGLLGDSRATSGLPHAVAALGVARVEEDDPYAAAPPPKKRAAPAPAPVAEEFEDVQDFEDVEVKAEKPAAKPKAKAAPAPKVTSESSDDELDNILASFGNDE